MNSPHQIPHLADSTTVVPEGVYHLLINGRVQGVFFRASMQRAAHALSIRGWCRNRVDGAVEGIVGGEGSLMTQFLRWCLQGPPNAEVTRVAYTPSTQHAMDSLPMPFEVWQDA